MPTIHFSPPREQAKESVTYRCLLGKRASMVDNGLPPEELARPCCRYALQAARQNLLNSALTSTLRVSTRHVQTTDMDYKILLQKWWTFSLGPSPWAIIITALIAFSFPLLLHMYIYRSKAAQSLPTFLLVGPSGSGKTSLLTLVYSPSLLQYHHT